MDRNFHASFSAGYSHLRNDDGRHSRDKSLAAVLGISVNPSRITPWQRLSPSSKTELTPHRHYPSKVDPAHETTPIPVSAPRHAASNNACPGVVSSAFPSLNAPPPPKWLLSGPRRPTSPVLGPQTLERPVRAGVRAGFSDSETRVDGACLLISKPSCRTTPQKKHSGSRDKTTPVPVSAPSCSLKPGLKRHLSRRYLFRSSKSVFTTPSKVVTGRPTKPVPRSLSLCV